jgi:alpha-beta hydrolase superfamily lysophospholipase
LAKRNLEAREQPGARGAGGDRGGLVRRLAGRVDRSRREEDPLSRPIRRAPLAARFGRFALFIAAIAIGGCAYLSEKQGDLIFNPSHGAWRGFNPADYSFEDHWVAVGGDQKLHAWYLRNADPNAPAMLYLHGAGWDLTGSATRIERWRKLGFSVLALDYRGFGRSAHIAPTEASAYEDAEAAWSYLGTLAPGRPRFVVGHSLGGAIAAEVALRHPEAAGLVLEATFTSVSDMVKYSEWSWLPVALILTQKFDTLAKIPDIKVPILITHGTRDSTIPVEMSRRLYEAARAPKKLVIVEGAGHHNLSAAGADAYRSAIAELFKPH